MHSLSKRINGSFTSLIRHVISISPLPNLLKTHYCGQITSSQIGSSVTLSGWLTHVRHIGPNLHFLVLRDETGSSQVLFNTESVRVMGEDKAAEIGNLLKELSVESVVCVNGTVQPRPKTTTTTTARESEETQVEVLLHDFKVLNACSRLPFTPSKGHPVPNEEYRLQHRYMDLRRPQLNSNIRTRSTVAHHIRSFLHERGLVEIETPLLFKSTPEGAREFIVPSRSEKGEFYALPQSPQQYKQILMYVHPHIEHAVLKLTTLN